MKYLVVVVIFYSFAFFISAIFFRNQRVTQLCVNSNSPNIQSMCVICDAGQYRVMSYSCVGQYFVPNNVTQEQAFCLLSTCLRQIPQQGQPVGRRKRWITKSSKIKKIQIMMDDQND